MPTCPMCEADVDDLDDVSPDTGHVMDKHPEKSQDESQPGSEDQSA